MIDIEYLPTCSVGLSAVIATEPSQKMTPSQFIEEYLQFVREARTHSKFFSILLITTGIEFLGKCLDDKNGWSKEQLTGPHFRLVIENYMPQYKKHHDFYQCLRGGFNHALAPQGKFGICSNKKIHNTRTKDGILVIDADIFFKDFEKATYKVLEKIANKGFPVNDKVYRPYLYIS